MTCTRHPRHQNWAAQKTQTPSVHSAGLQPVPAASDPVPVCGLPCEAEMGSGFPRRLERGRNCTSRRKVTLVSESV